MKKLSLNKELLLVQDAKGNEVYPYNAGDTRKIMQDAIVEEFALNRRVIRNAEDFINRFPTVESLYAYANQKLYGLEHVLNKYKMQHFIIDFQSHMIDPIVESVILKDFYNCNDAIEKTKEELGYNQLVNHYSQRPIASFFETSVQHA